MIIVLGLGPGDAKLLTREAWDLLSASERVYLRTRRHPAVAGLPPHLELHDFDALYDDATSFDDVYVRIAEAVIEAARTASGDVIYAVPGHPLVGEASVWLILQRARQLGIPTRLVGGLSFIEPTLEALSAEFLVSSSDHTSTAPTRLSTHNLQPLSLDPLDGLQICDALEIAALHHPPLNPDKPALIAQIHSRAVASDVKLTLMNQYPPQHPVFVVRGGVGSEGGAAPAASPCLLVPLSRLDHADRFDHLTSLYVPPLPQPGGLESLQETIAHLRAPEGCPWDREQTHESLRSTLLEETYEVLAAIDAGDLEALKEELGDLLLNVVLQAQIAAEAEEFRMSDVIAEVDAKLRRRHPHVFGDVVVNDSGEVVANWNAIKRREKAEKGEEDGSVLDGIAPALPALAQAQKMAHRAEKAGFRWNSHGDRLAKVREELEEAANARDDAHRAEEIGDLLFTIADWADGYGIDVETAAREANLKFARRFRALERIARERGLTLSAMSQAEMLAIWQEIKQSE
ncbi:MAG: nucleoside triphosphate pyrophosphohydrolase [Candidatus Roseilinea sp.]|nr:MAG: nucleoside triphosphate pyrophosphohydrolase [Candidatus Roseilinea sp.]